MPDDWPFAFEILSEFCTHCGTVTSSRTRSHPDGIEFVCKDCGNRVDFIWNEDDQVKETGDASHG